MKKMIEYLDSSGNITALLEQELDDNTKRDLTSDLLKKNICEQVGYISTPQNGGDCRIDMASNEFSANATRAYGYHFFANNTEADKGSLLVEISGVNKPLKVYVDREVEEAFTEIPFVEDCEIYYINYTYNDIQKYLPVVKMEGINHIIFNINDFSSDIKDEFFAYENDEQDSTKGENLQLYKTSKIVDTVIEKLLKSEKIQDKSAVGIMFISNNHIFPYEAKKSINSYCWKSSCGSGTAAYFNYLLLEIIKKDIYRAENNNILLNGIYKQDGNIFSYEKTFIEPGGKIKVKGKICDNRIVEVLVGGSVTIYE